MNLDLLRQKIDSLDTQLIQLLNERAYTAISIGQAKKQTSDGSADDSDHHVFIPGREKKIFDKVMRRWSTCVIFLHFSLLQSTQDL